MQINRIFIGLFLTFSAAFLFKAFAHEEQGLSRLTQTLLKTSNDQLSRVNELYKDKVKPVFQEKCFDCHSQNTRFPWYYKIPGVKQLIDSDIEEAREHLDFSNDFPFEGHGDPVEDLDSIQEVLEDNSMPPLLYWVLHRNSDLTGEEKQLISEWVEESKAILEKEK